MRMLRRIGILLMVGGLVALAALYLTQDLQVYPRAVASWLHPLPEVALPPHVEREWLVTRDDCRLEVWKMKPANAKGVVLVLHGNGDVLDDFVSVPEAFYQGGYTAYAFDYRGFGRSSCWPSESGLQTDTEAVATFAAAVEKLSDPRDLIVYGFSLGTGPASWLATKMQNRKLILGSPYTSLPDVARWRGFPEPLPSLSWTVFPTKQRFAEMGNTDVLVVAMRDDGAVPFEQSEALKNFYRGSGKVLFREVQARRHWEVAGQAVSEGLNWLASSP